MQSPLVSFWSIASSGWYYLYWTESTHTAHFALLFLLKQMDCTYTKPGHLNHGFWACSSDIREKLWEISDSQVLI